jgi:hypothetical protein
MRIGPSGKAGPGRIYNSSRAPDMGAMSPQIHGSTLSLSGACFDAVVGPCVPIQDTIQSASIQPFLDLCLSLDVVYTATNQVREEVLWRTWIGDFYQICPAPSSLATSFRSFICYHVADKIADLFLEDGLVQFEPALIALETLTQSSGHLDILPGRKEIVDSTIDMQTLRNLLRNPSIETENEVRELDIKIVEHAQRFDEARSATNLKRGLFRTSKGFLGLGPCSMRAGDEVWMLQNALVPFILRKDEHGESYSLIGEAYLHGFMQGEMLTPELVERIGIVNIS